jgi:hypothetical protein
MKRQSFFLLCVAIACAQAPAAPPRGGGSLRPTSSFSDVMERGYQLAAYQKALAGGTPAASKLLRAPSPKRHAIAVPSGRQLDIRIGELDDARQNFLVSADASFSAEGTWLATPVNPPRAEPGFTAAAARAIETAQRGLTSQQRLNAAVIPSLEKQLYVYLYPAAGEPVLGPDWRFLVSPDGNTLLETRVMHEAEARPALEGKRVAAMAHRHPNEELEDSDVAFSISHQVGDLIMLPSTAAIILNESGVPNYFTSQEMQHMLDLPKAR